MERKTLPLSLLIGNLVTVYIVFLSGEIIFRHGALAGLLMFATVAGAYLFIIPFLRIKVDFGRSGFLVNIIFLLWFMENIVIHILILTFLIQVVNLGWLVLISLTIMFFILLSLLYSKWKKAKNVFLLSNLTLLFVLAIFLPNYTFLQEGLETVYHNLLHYHPHILHLSMDENLTAFLLLMVIFFSKLLISIPFLQQFMTDFFKGARKLFVGILIIGTLILAFSTMTIVTITRELDPLHANMQILLLIKSQSAPSIFYAVFFILYVLSVLAIVITYIHYKEQLGNWSRSLNRKAFTSFLWITMIVVLSILAIYMNLTAMDIFLFTGTVISILTFLFILPKSLALH